MKLLSEKIFIFLLLLGGEKINSLTTFLVEPMQLITTKYTFALWKLLKHSRPGYVYRPVTYKNYPQNIKLCPLRLITEYIKKRSNLLQSNTSMKSYFMTYRKPIRAAHRETVTRWTKNIMHESGYVMLSILYLKSTHKNSSQKIINID